MSAMVPLVMFSWIPVVLALFWWLPARRAVVAAFVIAWLFLPTAEYSLSGLPDYSKMSATSVGVLAAAALFDGRALRAFRPAAIDLPMALWCVVPMLSSLSNELGLYDGASQSLHATFKWGLPYLIGRVYFTRVEHFHVLARGIVWGGLVYVPLCLFEIRMSPQLHRMVYGYHPHSFAQTLRFGGYRPVVFMEHGLMVGMWMAAATLVAIWLYKTGLLTRWPLALRGWTIPSGAVVAVLVVTTVLCKSIGALGLLAAGVLALWAASWLRWSLPVIALALMAPTYMAVRSAGWWSGEPAVAWIASTVSVERSESLAFRLRNESMLIDKALERPLFGWGGWGRARVYGPDGKDISTTDGLWVIALGDRGLVGLAAFTLALLWPALTAAARAPPLAWGGAVRAPVLSVAVVVVIYLIDCLLNDMLNPVFMVAAGGLAAIGASTQRR